MQNLDLKKIEQMCPQELSQWVAQCESRFLSQFDSLEAVDTARILFLSGPSCSGKTTTSQLLSQRLRAQGKEVVTVSTDDFFLDTHLAPRNPDGTPNYESFDFIDSDLLLQVVEDICQGRPYRMPSFDFKTKSRRLPEKPTLPTGNEVILVEGIHALNDKFQERCAHLDCAGIYICPGEILFLNGRMLFEKDDIRFLRRLVRDHRHRNTTAMETFHIWQNVLEGEDLFITPFLKNAQVFFSSTFAYEPFLMKAQALPLLEQVPDTSPFRFKANSLKERLNRLIDLPQDLLPAGSLLNEFLR